MRTNRTDSLIDHLRRAVLLPDGVGLGDGELLGRFIERHDEAAFAVLVNRHGPMVWGVCRRLLHEQDAEDAFQATFLVLARKATSIRSKEMVGNWLYGVAHQTSLQARRTAARRRAKEVQVTKMPDIKAVELGLWADIQPLLDEELSRLPDIYRAVIVLCDLEGQTRKEVASHLGVPEGTVAARMARARALLAKRLTRRGVVFAGGSVAAVLSAGSASASAPPALVASTIKSASLLAAGRAAGVISAKVAALTEGVVKAMFVTKIKIVLAVVLVVAALAGAAGLIYQTQAADQPKPKEEPPAAKKDQKQGEEKQATTKEEEKLRVLKVKALLKERRDILKDEWETVLKREDIVPDKSQWLDTLCHTLEAILEVDLDLSDSPADRLAAYKNAMDSAQKLENNFKDRMNRGLALPQDYMHAKELRLKVEISMTKEQMKQNAK